MTSWEFQKLGIPATLLADSAAGMLMRQGRIGCVITGADRIAANGDTANKIGTYSLAVLAKEHGIPFYVAAPTSTIDLSLPDGDGIEIEERAPEEVTRFGGVPDGPGGRRGSQPRFRCYPSPLHQRHRNRMRCGIRPLRGEPATGGSRRQVKRRMGLANE